MPRKLRICSTLREAELHADYVQVLEGLARKGHEVFSFLHVPKTTWQPDIETLHISLTNEPLKLDRLSVLNTMSLKCARQLRRQNIDVVHAAGTRLGEGLVAGLLAGKPVVCDVRNPWSIQWKDFRQRLALKSFIGQKARRLRYFSEEKLIHRAAHICAYSSGIKKWLIDHLGLPEEKITVVPPHVDTNHFRPGIDASRIRQKFGLGNAFVLMYVGTMNHSRGIDLLIDAARRLREAAVDAKLLLIGPQHDSASPYFRDLKQQVNDAGLNGEVIFSNYIPFSEVPEYTAAADVCVVPHRPNFTYDISPPVKLLEYMASQKPIVTTDVGIRDFIADGFSGLIVEPDNPQALAEALLRLQRNPASADKIAKNARQFVLDNLRQEMMVNKFEQLLSAQVAH